MVEHTHLAGEIVENLPLGVVVVNDDLQVVDLNPAAEKLLDCTLRHATGRRLSELSGPELCAEGSALRDAMETGESAEPRISVLTGPAEPAGSGSLRRQRHVWVGAVPIRSGYLLTLREPAPMDHIPDDLVSDISHDIRGPLASIRAYTELLIDEVDQGDAELRRHFLDVIDERSRHVTDLVVNLTGLVRRSLGHLELSKTPVALSEMAREAAEILESLSRQQDVRLVVQEAEGECLVAADRDALGTALRNVIENAVKFSTAGGDVVVSVRRVGRRGTVTVVDSGCGIASEDMPQICQAFYRGQTAIDAGVEGSGLGLAVARAIIEAHDGEMELTSEEGSGTRVTIALPAAQQAATT